MSRQSLLKTSGASWVWPANSGRPNQYVEFRHEFYLDHPPEADAELQVSVDTNYAAWMNGAFLDCGQFHDFQDDKTYDTLPLGGRLKTGKNVLNFLVHYQGEGSSQYMTGAPGLIYALKAGSAVLVSGRETCYRQSPSYVGGPLPRITLQLGFTFEYDAAGDDDWLSTEYAPDRGWCQAGTEDIVAVSSRTLRQRPLKKLAICERVPVAVIAHGVFRRERGAGKTIAKLMQNDFLSARPAGEVFKGRLPDSLPSDCGIELNVDLLGPDRGIYLVLDLGREEAGLFDLELEATAGTIVDVAYGEHLDDLRVRAAVGDRNFANRYTCRSGPHCFTHYFTRFAGRYIELHISGAAKEFVLYYAGLKPVEYPVRRRGSLDLPDKLQENIHQVAVRTLHLCMHEHYEDCPWREQGLYAMDSRNQALCGYYCFGDYRFPAVSFSLLGQGLKDDGYLQLTAPAELDLTIPSFSMAWMMALADHYLYSGRVQFARRMLPKVRKMLRVYRRAVSDDLIVTPQGKRYWPYYEWADGLDGTVDGDCTRFDHLDVRRFDAPFNLFYCMALDSAAVLARACGALEDAEAYESQAGRLRNAFQGMFWDQQEGAYRTYVGERAPVHYAELTQALAVCARACPGSVAAGLRERLACKSNGLVETTLSHSLYKFEALLGEPDKYATWVFERIAEDWGHMLFNGATSFWETIKGASDFDNAGSLCHGWSGIPVYFYGAYLLGVRPVEPGFKTFKVDPVLSVVSRASGRVPTPRGCIELDWEQAAGKVTYSLRHPEGTSPEIAPSLQMRASVESGPKRS